MLLQQLHQDVENRLLPTFPQLPCQVIAGSFGVFLLGVYVSFIGFFSLSVFIIDAYAICLMIFCQSPLRDIYYSRATECPLPTSFPQCHF